MIKELIFEVLNLWVLLFVGVLAFIGSFVGHFLSHRIFKIKRHDVYAMAALDKKMEAHQTAFSYAWKFPDLAHNKDTDKRVSLFNEIQEWYIKNCIYLEPITRNEFYSTLWKAENYYIKLDLFGQNKLTHEELIAEWKALFKIRQTILDGVSEPLIIPFKDTGDPTGKT